MKRIDLPLNIMQSMAPILTVDIDGLTLFGLFTMTLMLVFYALEDSSHWYVLAFAGACALASVYGFLRGPWTIGVLGAVLTLLATRRWWFARHIR